MKKKKQLTSIICAVTLLAGVFAYGRGHFQTPQPLSAEFKQQDIYDHMFQDYAALKSTADKVEREGKNGQGLRTYYKRQAKLTDKEADQLDKIAADAMRERAKIDDKVQKIVDEVRARVPGGRLKPGRKRRRFRRNSPPCSRSANGLCSKRVNGCGRSSATKLSRASTNLCSAKSLAACGQSSRSTAPTAPTRAANRAHSSASSERKINQ